MKVKTRKTAREAVAGRHCCDGSRLLAVICECPTRCPAFTATQLTVCARRACATGPLDTTSSC